MKKIYQFFIAIIISYNINAQSFYYQLSYGTKPDYVFTTSGTPILSSASGNLNDVLSSAQTLPFAWNFEGKPVTQYKASDNGYITFDITATTSYPSNASLPNTGGPNKAIYAFWDDLELKSYNTSHDYIYTWTYGTAPNRIHVIQWSGVTPRNQNAMNNSVYFAIRIYEAGYFDVVYDFRNSVTLSGTTGVEDSSGTIGAMVTGSPNINLPSAPVLEPNRPVYTFFYGIQPSIDASGISHTLPEIASVGTNVNVSGALINYGSQPINSYRLNYSVNNGPVYSHNISGLNIATNSTTNFSHSIPWPPSGAGSFQHFKMWADNINGNVDQANANDTLKGDIFVNQGIHGNKKTLVEEYSTAPCGYCPNGHYVLDTILNHHHDILGFTHHAGYQTDAMTIPASTTLASEFAPGAPYATFDRVGWPGEFYPSTSNRDVWSSRAVTRLNTPTPVNVALFTSWNSSSRQLDIFVSSYFVDYAFPGDLRMSVFIIEDSVTGTGAGYDQTNYYNSTVGTPFYNRGNPMVGYTHRHVIRAAPSGAWGTAGIIPHNPMLGQYFSNTYSYIVPANFDEKKMNVIAFVNYYDANGRREILNAEEHMDITNSMPEIEKNKLGEMSVYPNPSSGITAAKFNLTTEDRASLLIYNTIGEQVFSSGNKLYTSGSHTIFFDSTNLPAGIYTLSLQTSRGTTCEKLIVSR